MNLTTQARALRYEPTFKRMVIQAAERLLRSRGVTMIVDKDEPPRPPLLPLAPDPDLPPE